MNYIKHLNGILNLFSKDSRLNPTHISLYFALFHLWNLHRFPEIFFVHREELMRISKIGSKSTYHRCLKELNHWKYLYYFPSHNPLKGSRVKMFKFGTTGSQVPDKLEATTGQEVEPLINIIKHESNFIKRDARAQNSDVKKYFEKKKWPQTEASKFLSYYQSTGWKTAAGNQVTNWKALASLWVTRSRNEYAVSQNKDNLKTTKDKNYGEPL